MNRGSLAGSASEQLSIRIASMRPRFMNRGSVRTARTSSKEASGFNEAPIHESGKSLTRRDSQTHDRPLQ